MQNAKLLNYLHLHFIVFIWGFTAVLGALISIEAIPLVWYRMLIASLLIFGWVVYKKTPLKFPKKTLAGFLIAGAIIAAHWLTFFGAIKVSNVSITLAVLSTGAFFTSILEPIYYKRKVIWYEVAFGVLVIAGLCIIFNVEGDYFWGIVMALTSAFLSALFSVINGKFAVKYDASVISFYELGFGMLCITVYLLFSGSFTAEFFKLQMSDWVYLAILASACTAYAFIASVHVMKWISPYTVMLTINMEPVYGIILALLILGDSENMSPQFYYGAALIVMTVVANGIIKNKTQRKKRRLGNS
ncbi:permease [Patiriisocius marinistellae]|uniref:Permease n=1 Tax=Patiriisocius marinistellae TaxID=2494560 RepID=A0A5J4FV28_9FLAO|nr:DMT family transporter [Patiriisocius marinistellae]GEQ85800.1 permease [Patiriisocius marinistellae]